MFCAEQRTSEMSNIAGDIQTDGIQSGLERRETLRKSESKLVANAVAAVRGIGLLVPLMLTMCLGIYFVIKFMRF
jgi:hypothetical protein